jgi:ABC-type nitrate/sulfonate/bicarbonate transport system permease component
MRKSLAWPYAVLRGLVALVVAALLWELAARYVEDPIRVPALPVLLQGIIGAYVRDAFWGHAWSSLQSFLAGYALAAVVGVPLGLLLGSLRPVRFVLGSLVTALSVSPLVVLVPLFVQWLGIGMATRIAVAFVAAVFPLAATIGAALGREHATLQAPPDGSQPAKTGVSNAMRAIVAGLRVGVVPAAVGVVIGEMLASQVGLGNLMMLASASVDVPFMAAIFIVATVPCLVLANILRAVETRLSR